jgi:hypothetical protein
MNGARIGRAAAALLCAVAAAASTASRAEEEGAAAGGAPAIRISGEVRRGERFERKLSETLRLVLQPVHGGEGSGADGWQISVFGPDSIQDFVRIATPPYHGVNESVIQGWHFRGRSAGTNEGRVNAPQTERGFYFVTTPADYESYRTAVDALLWPEGLADAALDSIQVAMDQIPKGEGLLTIRSMTLDGLGPGESPWFEWMRFDVELKMPGGRQ